MKQDTLNHITGILKKYSFEKKKLANIEPEMKLIEDFKINSARIVDIVLDIEETFDIEIDDNSLEKIINIQDVLDIVEQKS
jgi:acyl carrier protein